MSIVRSRSHSSDSPDSTCWQIVRGRGNVVENSDDYGQFRRHGRRRDSLPSSLGRTPGNCPPTSPTSSHSKCLNNLTSGSPPKFAMTPAEFNLFPSSRSTGNWRKPQNAELERQEECLGVGHLTTLRSAAFWELRQSIIENGEGLVRRMRDFEQSRLHQQVRQRAKERKKRGRKSSTLQSRRKAQPNASEASDEDDVLIYSEDPSTGLSRWSPRARSFDSMDVDGEDQDHLGRRGSRSMRGDYSQVQHYLDEGTPFVENSSRTKRVEVDSESLLSYSDSASPTPSSTSFSLPLPQPLLMTTSSSDKALDDLNIAFVSGACCITDYSPIWTYQQQFDTDEQAVHGDLWR